MRVIQIAPTPFGEAGLFGGGERYPLELSRALAAHVECELISFGRRPSLVREQTGLQRRTLRAVGWLAGHPAQPVAPGLIAALARAQIVHTHHTRSLPSKLGALAARARGQPAVTTDHGLQGSDWGGWLQRLFSRFLLVSSYSAVELRAPAKRTRIIYGGADPVRFFPDPGIQRSGVLFIGRLTPHKGVDRLLEALPAGAHLTVVGSTGHDPRLPEREYPRLLRWLASGRDVQFAGVLPDDDLPERYRSAAVLALPSVERTCYGNEVRVSELLGLVVLEAMASGTPVVASRLGGLVDIVQDGITGFLVTPGDIGELHDRLAELLADQQLAGRMGGRARELAVDRYTWSAVAQRCLSAYAELTRPEPPRS